MARRPAPRSNLFIVLVFVLTGIVLVAVIGGNGAEFYRTYRHLEPGMSLVAIEQALGGKPFHTCALGEYTVSYFRRPGPVACFVPLRLPGGDHAERVSLPDEIPYIYDAVQVLADADGRATAITWNGESLEIRTVDGKFAGSHVATLPPRFFGLEPSSE